jgi:hypothetical protein
VRVGRTRSWRRLAGDLGAVAPGKKRGRERTVLMRGPGLAARGKRGAGARAGEKEVVRRGELGRGKGSGPAWPTRGKGERRPEGERENWAGPRVFGLVSFLLLSFSFSLL